MTAQMLIDTNDDMPYMAWKAKAVDYLKANGFTDDDIPSKKAGILDILTERAAEEGAGEEPAVPPSQAVEVELLHKYAPFFLLDEESGEWIKQGTVTQTLPKGLTYLHAFDAEKTIERGQSRPTANTFAQLKAAG